ncbi:MAG: gamma-glutamyltransferase family protein [Nitrospinaceae bacterium]|nr:gamma-glutamyltransferase family protein [Nitrospinaceae bacterium]MBT3434127.1 gamma-glutamyltransferase family protein [Nitrospinaceae bacterium]MBT4431479.1 gamma-glutamyltransferase family protein [Nitrospinaceae bacterium]MBT5947212.1 gamma-glutamyltransferase family protein [Nitrospinaceae bacterium]MBT6396790.1 gamma-glutamyltransferase family protein [Nitrospinaceae bacterium]
MASTGHPLATRAALRVLERGGNAIDAGVAAGICINVLLQDFTSFLGVAPIIVYLKKENRVVTIDGVGRWPRAASLEYFRDNHDSDMPVGVLRTVTPAAADAWLMALEQWGTMTFAEVAGDAIELAGEGYAMFPVLYEHIASLSESYSRWGETRKIYFRDGEVIPVGGKVYLKELAETMKRMARAEEKASGGRTAGIRAARDEIYKGETARRIVDFVQAEGGFLTMADLAECGVREETPVRTDFQGYEVYGCGPWCQGPVLPATLNLLEGTDFVSLGHNSPDYLHRLIGALDLCFADREHYYGDPDFIQVPLEGILSKSYAAERAGLLDRPKAFGEMPQAGNPWAFQGDGVAPQNGVAIKPMAAPETGKPAQDTSYCTVIDSEGNAFSATPSDPCIDTPIIPGVGSIVSPRGTQNWLDEGHPSAVAPWKRPRLTPAPALVLKDGDIFMTLGTPGGDVQPQAMLQVFLNVIEFGMLPQMAVEAPRVATYNFPNTFWPHQYNPGRTVVEERIEREGGQGLRERGYKLDVLPDYSRQLGSVCCIVKDPKEGVLLGGADARRASSAAGW